MKLLSPSLQCVMVSSTGDYHSAMHQNYCYLGSSDSVCHFKCSTVVPNMVQMPLIGLTLYFHTHSVNKLMKLVIYK